MPLAAACADVLGCDVAGGHDLSACPLAEVMAAGQPVAYRETAVRGPDGASIQVAGGYSAVAPSSPETDDPLARARATAILRDISAVRSLEELREGFVATVSHELRTPLSLIRGYTETLLHLELEPEQQRDYLQRIDEVTERLSSLVGQVLDITHLQADPLILERSPVQFASLVSRLAGGPRGRRSRRPPRRRAARRPATTRGGRATRRAGPREPRRERLQVRTAGWAP